MNTVSDFPELADQHLLEAKLYANRHQMIVNLGVKAGGNIAEVGVALGEFSKFMIRELKPTEFHAFDLFEIHKDEMLWSRPTSEVLEGLTHRQFYEKAMLDQDVTLFVEEGLSSVSMARQKAEHFDLVYVDAGHSYDDVKSDAQLASRMLKEDGVLVFNDYILHDPFINSPYGIVPAVNEMVVNEGWKVIGFALQKHMFCDIAITRA